MGCLGTAGPLFSFGLDTLTRERQEGEGRGEAVLWAVLGIRNVFPGRESFGDSLSEPPWV